MAAAVSADLHRGVRRSCVRAELGATRWGPVVGSAAGALTLAILDLTVWRGGPGSLLAWLAAALGGAAAALALDQPAGSVTDAAPCPARGRLAARLLVAVAAGGCWAVFAVLVVGGVPPGVPVSWVAVCAVGAGLILLGPAVAVLVGGPENREPGSLAASVVVSVVIGLTVVPLPLELDPFDVATAGGAATVSWGCVALASVTVLARSTRP